MSVVADVVYEVEPDPKLAQRMSALAAANRIRSRRAELKRELKAGRIGLLDLMEDPDCDSMAVGDAMLALPRVGRVKVATVLRRENVSPSRPIGRLTERERVAIAARVYGWAPR